MTTVIIRRKDRIDYIMNGLYNFWGINESQFRKPTQHNTERKDRKAIAAHILYHIGDLPLKDVSLAVGYTYANLHNIGSLRDYAEDKLAIDRNFKKEYSQIINYLKL